MGKNSRFELHDLNGSPLMDFDKMPRMRYQATATVILTHMIDFDFSAVECPISMWMSAEIKSYT